MVITALFVILIGLNYSSAWCKDDEFVTPDQVFILYVAGWEGQGLSIEDIFLTMFQ